MTLRILFTGEGSSDNGLVPHLEAVAAESGIPTSVTAPDFSRLGAPCRAVKDKLRVARLLGDSYDLIVVHRDADAIGAQKRRDEVARAIAGEWPDQPHVAVVPVRMLEAWLLLDEQAIRQVAENPRGTMPLELPRGKAVERVADPKKVLEEALVTASGYSGRRLAGFTRRFPQHRHKLLQRLDPFGPVNVLPSWRSFISDLRSALTR